MSRATTTNEQSPIRTEHQAANDYVKATLLEAFGEGILDNTRFKDDFGAGVSVREYLARNAQYQATAYKDFEFLEDFGAMKKAFKANPALAGKHSVASPSRTMWTEHALNVLTKAQHTYAKAAYLNEAAILFEPEEIADFTRDMASSPVKLYWSFLDNFIDKKVTLQALKAATSEASVEAKQKIEQRLAELDPTDPKKLDYLAAQEIELKRHGGIVDQLHAAIEQFRDPTRSFTERLAQQARETTQTFGMPSF